MATSVKRGDRAAPRPRPRGKAAITDAVLDAAERLFARSGPTAISLRDIADEAGVTYSLINRHFGTKEALFIELLDRYAVRWAPQLAQDSSRVERIDLLLGERAAQGPYLRLLAWSLLRGDAAAHGERSVLDQLLVDPPSSADRNDVAAVLALMFGWRFFHPFLAAALDIDVRELDAVHEHIRGVLRTLAMSPAPNRASFPEGPARKGRKGR